MNPQNVGTDKAEDQSAGEFHLSAEPRAQPDPCKDAPEAEDGSDKPCGGGQDKYGSPDCRKADSYRKGIDGCGEGHSEKGHSPGGIGGSAGRIAGCEGLPDHVSSHNEKKAEGHPMIVL